MQTLDAADPQTVHPASAVLAARALEHRTAADYRTAVCRWEDDLFAAYPFGHTLLQEDEGRAMLAQIFEAAGERTPALALVPGFADPSIGGFADLARHRIVIEAGHLYRYLVLHEAAHLLTPYDKRHGAPFVFVLQHLYRRHLGIPEAAIGRYLRRHGLPARTGLFVPS